MALAPALQEFLTHVPAQKDIILATNQARQSPHTRTHTHAHAHTHTPC